METEFKIDEASLDGFIDGLVWARAILSVSKSVSDASMRIKDEIDVSKKLQKSLEAKPDEDG